MRDERDPSPLPRPPMAPEAAVFRAPRQRAARPARPAAAGRPAPAGRPARAARPAAAPRPAPAGRQARPARPTGAPGLRRPYPSDPSPRPGDRRPRPPRGAGAHAAPRPPGPISRAAALAASLAAAKRNHPSVSRLGTSPDRNPRPPKPEAAPAEPAPSLAGRVLALAGAVRGKIHLPAAPPPDPADAATPAAAGAEGPAAAPGERPMWARVARGGLWVGAVATALVMLLVFVFPTRTWLQQRRQLDLAAARLHVLDAQNQALSAEAAKLQTDTEIEQVARSQYHMVLPGEHAYVIMPPPTPATTVPPLPPPAPPSHHAGLWHDLTSWL